MREYLFLLSNTGMTAYRLAVAFIVNCALLKCAKKWTCALSVFFIVKIEKIEKTAKIEKNAKICLYQI